MAEEKKKRKVKKCDYLVESLEKFSVPDNPLAETDTGKHHDVEAWSQVDGSDKFDDSVEAEKWIREHADDEKLNGKRLRIVRVCKRITVNTVTTTKVLLTSV